MAKEAVKTLAVRSHPAEPKIECACARAPDPAIERACDQAHASSTREVRVALVAIANLLRRGNSKTIIYDRSYLVRSNAMPTIERTRSCDRTHIIGSNSCKSAIDRNTCDQAQARDLVAH